MNLKAISLVGLLVVGAGVFWYMRRGASSENEIEYRYAKVAKGELMRSTTAPGALVALTSIDVRSKAGGVIVKLNVDAGSMVKKGDILAIIDPRDTRALYDQAEADVTSASARINQSSATYSLQRANSVTAVQDAQVALKQAELRLQKAQIAARVAPISTGSNFNSARASYEAAQQNLDRFVQITGPQRRRDAEGAARQTDTALTVAIQDLERQRELLSKGYVAQAVVDRAQATLESARSAKDTAEMRLNNIDRDLAAEERGLRLAIDQAKASLDSARARGSDVDTALRDRSEAEQAVQAARIALRQALDARMNDQIRAGDLAAARASAVRSRVALSNAKVQLDSTTVIAPRDGVVTQKYADEGAVIPGGVSQFSTGANIVQLSDVTRLFVDCTVDEADISNVAEGQKVRIVTEAFPGEKFNGVVRRVNPAAVTTNSITSITVRVEIEQGDRRVRLLPGMNATCEFITMSKLNVLIAPSQAIKRDGATTFVLVKGPDPLKPVRKEVKVGEMGNEGAEILSGLSENEEVVVAEIDLAQLRETQRRMVEAQQGGGLAGGRGPTMNSRGSRASGGASGGGGMGGSSGGGSRSGGGMGGGR